MARAKKKVAHKESEKAPRGSKRSSRWPSVRRKFLKENPCCAVCGANTGKLEVHHIVPFHIDKDLELDPSNFITLCENMNDGVSCHLLFGHLGSYRSYNVNVKKDASLWAKKRDQRGVITWKTLHILKGIKSLCRMFLSARNEFVGFKTMSLI